MSGEEIGFSELKDLARENWLFLCGSALFSGALALAAIVLWTPVRYEATAWVGKLGTAEPGGSAILDDARESLLVSETVVGETRSRLVEAGLIAPGQVLVIGGDLLPGAGEPATGRGRSSMMALTGRAADPELAAGFANTWARVFIDSSREVPRSSAAAIARLVEERLEPARQEVELLEAERLERMTAFEEREEEVTSSWDQRIVAARSRFEKEVASRRVETRSLFEAAALPPDASDVSIEVSRGLRELVALRAELARHPRIVTLENATDDEVLAQLALRGESVDLFEQTLITQEIDPLYEELTIAALEAEKSLLALEAGPPGDLAEKAAELERLQLHRSVELGAELARSNSELRSLRRQRAQALKVVLREKNAVLAGIARRLNQLQNLEVRLSTELNGALVTELLDQVDAFELVIPAVPVEAALPRRVVTRLAMAAFLGALLGMMVVLYRSTGDGSDESIPEP